MTAQDEIKELLLSADLDIEGVLPDASNLTARVLLSGTAERALYKPIQGEAPLRDFPDGTLAGREVAAYQVSALGGWDLIPQTVLRDGPLGPGSVQRWIDWEATGSAPGDGMLEAFAATGVPEGWLPIVHGEDQDGRPVVVAHRDSPDLASLAVLDLVLNNADRKGAHLVRDASGRLWGVDHGLTLHVQDKLRTVLWGWAGQPFPDHDRERLAQLHDALRPADTLADLISPEELTALIARVEALRTHPVFPDLPPDRYPLPWPLW
ncbi:SCO1664 family protein [Ornithinimicrobium ciconiae]|uniref:SCO1664 family protein n=1 Tax=Ornithinimicrobium ciconiae TaxID=2594265 RepID=UPI00192D29DE|nr:SCO1664 family protein [Ornithinimicrobium ciconiae]